MTVKKFRLNSKKIFLTYPTHIPFEDLERLIVKNIKQKIDKFIICHETAPDKDNKNLSEEDMKKPYLHTHAVFLFEKPINITDSKKLNVNNIHGDYKSCRKFEASILYCMKECQDKDKPNFKSNFDTKTYLDDHFNKLKRQSNTISKFNETIDNIKKCNNIEEALKNNCKSFKDVNAIIQLKQLCTTTDFRTYDPWENITLYKWQQSIIDNISVKSDWSNRKINWIYDKKGNKGKSILCDYAEDTLENSVFRINCAGRSSDIYNVILNKMSKIGKAPNAFFIDLPRSNEKKNSIYNSLECIVNGRITATKFVGGMVKFDRPHVYVFANFLPNLNAASLDRWNISELIEDNGDIIQKKLSFDQVIDKSYLDKCDVCSICEEDDKLSCLCLKQTSKYSNVYKKVHGRLPILNIKKKHK